MSSVQSEAPTRDPSKARALGVVAVMFGLSAAYLVFVTHYTVNAIFSDDWSVVRLVHAALHGHLALGALWAQHLQNRMLVANLIFVTWGVLTHESIPVIVVLNALIFVATFFMFLALFRSNLRRPLTPLAVLVLGLVWFSLEGWQNALWGFQLAWYLVLFFLIVMLYLLLVARRRNVAFVFAILAAVAASFSVFQGLALWPVGLVCLLWDLPSVTSWTRRRKVEAVVWLGAATITTGVYFWGYTSQPTGFGVKGTPLFDLATQSPSFALHHPLRTAEFFLVEIGEVIPNTNAHTLWLSGLLGAALLVVTMFVAVQSVRHRRGGRNCLPLALIIFGLSFDLFIAVGRVDAGLSVGATQSRYTMANLLILIAIVTYAWALIQPGSDWVHGRPVQVAVAVGVVFLAIQVSVATSSGLAQAKAFDQRLTTADRLVVNLDAIPVQASGCYSFYGIFAYLYPVPNSLRFAGFAEAREDQLGAFAPGLVERYRAEGLPDIPQCRTDRTK